MTEHNATPNITDLAPLESDSQIDRDPGHARVAFSFRTFLFGSLCVSVWIGFFVFDQKSQTQFRELVQLRIDAGSLLIADDRLVATVENRSPFAKTDSWKIYLPPNSSYRLAVATGGLTEAFPDEGDLPKATQLQIPIEPGTHEIELTNPSGKQRELGESGPVIPPELIIDGKAHRIPVDENWISTGGYSQIGVGRYSIQHSPGKQVTILNRVFLGKTADFDSGVGIAIWLEPQQH